MLRLMGGRGASRGVGRGEKFVESVGVEGVDLGIRIGVESVSFGGFVETGFVGVMGF